MDNRIFIGAGLLVAALLLVSVAGPGFIGSSDVQSVSATTLNGKPAVLVQLYGGGAGDIVETVINQNSVWTAPPADVYVAKSSDNVVYQLTERDASRGEFYIDPTPALSCDGISLNLFNLGNSCNNPNLVPTDYGSYFNNFQAACSKYPNSVFFYSGIDAIDPHYRCYVKKPYIVISDFNSVGTQTTPFVAVDVMSQTGLFANGERLAHAELDNNHQSAALIGPDKGTDFGIAQMVSQISGFQSPPEASSILGLRYYNQFGPAYSYQIVPNQAVSQAFSQSETTYSNCINSARDPGFGSYNLNSISNCINSLKSNLDSAYATPRPTAFQNANFSLTTRQLSITNTFSVPIVKLTLYADQVGILKPNAIPSGLFCTATIIPGGTTGQINAVVSNIGQTGAIFYDTTCTSGSVNAAAASGSVSVNSGSSTSLVIPITAGQFGQSQVCTINAHSSDLKISGQVSCTVQSTNACTNVPPQGFLLNLTTCTPYCPLVQSQCPSGSILVNNLTSGICACQNINQPTQQVQPTNPTNTTTPACLPIVQTLSITSYTGGILGIGATPVYSCTTDWLGTGIVAGLIGVAIIYSRRRRR